MKPYITTWEAAMEYRKYKRERFSPLAFREFLYQGFLRELEKCKNFSHIWKEDFNEWLNELHKFDLCFWTWVDW